jgi:hypothetical protein
MRTLFFLLIFTALLHKPVLSQADYTLSYYPLTNRAELSIVDSNYQAALRSYDSAFQQVPKAFAKDYFNALVCAVKIGKHKQAYRYSDSLIAKGVPKSFFLEHSSLAPLRLAKNWKQYLNRYERTYQRLRADKDTSLAVFFQQLHDRDQEFRKKPGSYIAYRDTINKIDSQNISALRQIIATRGFPNENMMAVSNPTSVQLPAYIVFHHYCQGLSRQREGKYNFTADFIAAVKRGELAPHRFASLLGLQGERGIELGGMGISQCTLGETKSPLLAEKYAPAKQARIDKDRLMHGLESLEAYYKKAVFALKNNRAKDFAFGVYKTLNIYEMADEEQFEKFVAASEVLK